MHIVKLASAAIAAGMAVASVGAQALEAHEEIEAALEAGAVVEFQEQDVIVRAQMPCDNPEAGPPGPEGLQSQICLIGETMYLFASSFSVPPTAGGALTSDFDATYKLIEESHDTVMVEEREENGRRVMVAERGPDTQFGLTRVIQYAPDGLAIVVAMSAPGDAPVSEAEKQIMRNFAASLEIVQ